MVCCSLIGGLRMGGRTLHMQIIVHIRPVFARGKKSPPATSFRELAGIRRSRMATVQFLACPTQIGIRGDRFTRSKSRMR